MSRTMVVTPHAKNTARHAPLKKWLPVAGLAVAVAAVYVFGLHTYLTLETVAENRDRLKAFVAGHLIPALLIYVAAYIAVVALSLPGAAAMSIAGGFLFGWMLSAPVTLVAATVGATIVFEVVKTSFGTVLAERAGPFVRKFSAGFAEDAFNYLLFLRLVPAFPFFVVNAVAGLCNVPLKTFAAATVLGIIPGTIAFAWLGTGLDSIIDAQAENYRQCRATGAAECAYDLTLANLVTGEILLAFAALGVVALLPVAYKYWRPRRQD
jgi:uncharacterized membrane protein YdjX (TVP38/TMEM64 family)